MKLIAERKDYKNQSVTDTIFKHKRGYGEATFIGGLLGTKYYPLPHGDLVQDAIGGIHCTTEGCFGRCCFQLASEEKTAPVEVMEAGYSVCTCSREAMTIEDFCSMSFADASECRFTAISCWLANNPRQDEFIVSCGFSYEGLKNNTANTYIFLETEESITGGTVETRRYCLPMHKRGKGDEQQVYSPKMFFVDLAKFHLYDAFDAGKVAAYWNDLVDPEEDRKMPASSERAGNNSETDILPRDLVREEEVPAVATAPGQKQQWCSLEESICDVGHTSVFAGGPLQPVHHVIDLNTRQTCNCAQSGLGKCPHCIEIYAYSRFRNTQGSASYTPNCYLRSCEWKPRCETCRAP